MIILKVSKNAFAASLSALADSPCKCTFLRSNLSLKPSNQPRLALKLDVDVEAPLNFICSYIDLALAWRAALFSATFLFL